MDDVDFNEEEMAPSERIKHLSFELIDIGLHTG